jgi:hypothetical protein
VHEPHHLGCSVNAALPAHVRGTMLAMSMDVGRIAEENQTTKEGTRVRVFLDFGRRNGRYQRLYSIPGPAGKRIALLLEATTPRRPEA